MARPSCFCSPGVFITPWRSAFGISTAQRFVPHDVPKELREGVIKPRYSRHEVVASVSQESVETHHERGRISADPWLLSTFESDSVRQKHFVQVCKGVV